MKDSTIQNEILGSDHCPIQLKLNLYNENVLFSKWKFNLLYIKVNIKIIKSYLSFSKIKFLI